jgi:hypothetical protein
VLALVWLLATVLAATVAWWAVTAVGGERGTDGGEVVSQERVAELLAARTPRDGTPGTGTGAGADGVDRADATPAPATPAPPPATDDGTGTTTPPADTGAGPAPAPAAPAPAAATDVARTWDVPGGQVAAVCTGATIRLLYATPAPGWSVEVDGVGPERVEVELSADGERSRLRARCVDGVPQTVAGDGEGDDGRDDGDDDD